jgi:hypothetical protein
MKRPLIALALTMLTACASDDECRPAASEVCSAEGAIFEVDSCGNRAALPAEVCTCGCAADGTTCAEQKHIMPGTDPACVDRTSCLVFAEVACTVGTDGRFHQGWSVTNTCNEELHCTLYAQDWIDNGDGDGLVSHAFSDQTDFFQANGTASATSDFATLEECQAAGWVDGGHEAYCASFDSPGTCTRPAATQAYICTI